MLVAVCRRLSAGPLSRHWRDPQAGAAKRCKGPLRCDEPSELPPVHQALGPPDWPAALEPVHHHFCPIKTQSSLVFFLPLFSPFSVSPNWSPRLRCSARQ